MVINIYFILMLLCLLFSFVGFLFIVLERKIGEIIITLSLGILFLSVPFFLIGEGVEFTKTILRWKEEQKARISKANYI